MTVRIFFLDDQGEEETLCKDFVNEDDIDIEVSVLTNSGCQVMAWVVV